MINLLPPQYKKYLAEEERYRIILILMVVVFLFLISLFLILFSVKIYISGEAQNQKVFVQISENKFEISETKEIEKKVQSINQTLSGLSSFYEKQPYYTDLLERVADILPEKSYFTALTLKYLSADEGTEVFLRGFSPDREALAEFKSALEKQPDFYELDFPPSNWINPDNFSVNFKVK
ncbi:MAG: hypothetical protein DRZ76_01200 [Candidatus Nealsonbacteria bacterium]|nr:MAG: hypothetical protein DRZ76_01200 [Candidatus Nealsonbacteria bacterium]